jgi:hypothetical protein
MKVFKNYLEGNDLKSITDVEKLIPMIKSQNDFNF